MADASSNDIVVTLPPASDGTASYLVIRTDQTSGTSVTIEPDAASPADTFNYGDASVSVTTTPIRLLSDGVSVWYTI
jgi:hypothetical protein